MIICIGNHIKRTLRQVGKHQRCNQKPQIEEEQTIQWPKEKGQKYILTKD
jgi:hypothetical protein